VEVSGSLYAMTIVELASLSRKRDGDLVFFAETIRVMFMLCLNYAMTCFFISQLGKMVAAQFALGDRECDMDFLILIFICVFMFEVSMLGQLGKCMRLMELLYFANPAKSAAPLTYSPVMSTASSDACLTLSSIGSGAGAIVMQEKSLSKRVKTFIRHPIHGDKEDQHGIKRWSLHETRLFYRMFCFFVIVLPKLVADMMLAYLGGLYIASTDKGSDMLLNTLAVVFIAEVDEIMYSAFTSAAMKYNLENMKPVMLVQTSQIRTGMWLFHGFGTPALALGFSYYATSHVSGCTFDGTIGDFKQALQLMTFFPRRTKDFHVGGPDDFQ